MDQNINIGFEMVEIKDEFSDHIEIKTELMDLDEIKQEDFEADTLNRCEIRIKQEDSTERDVEYSVDEFFTESEIKIEETQLIDALKIGYECYLCKSTSFTNINDIQLHMSNHTIFKSFDPLECTECSKRCVSVSDLKRHSYTHSNDRTIGCELCPKKFKTMGCLRQHMRKHTDAKKYECSECTKKLKTANGFKIHMLIHRGEKPFHCKLCSFKCTTSGRLLYHTRSYHTGEKTFACAICPKRFSSSGSLAMHRRVHSGEKPYACDHCPMKFNQTQALKRHKLTHEEARVLFECTVRSKKLFTEKSLQSHMDIHTKGAVEKRYKCNFCAYESRHSSNMHCHQGVHERKSYVCNQCPKVFTLKSSLSRHMRVTH